MPINGNEDRCQATRRAIKNKIEVLRAYIETQPPKGTFVPKNIRQFREWEDTNLKLRKIGSPGTLNVKQTPHNRDLIEELQQTLGELSRIATKPRKKVDPLCKQLDEAKQELNILNKLVERLTSQLHETRHALKQAQSSEKVALLSKNKADETIAWLRRNIAEGNQRGITLIKE